MHVLRNIIKENIWYKFEHAPLISYCHYHFTPGCKTYWRTLKNCVNYMRVLLHLVQIKVEDDVR